MLVTTIGYLILAAFVPLDWTHITLDSLSPVTGHYHGTTWAMAEVTEEDDGEKVEEKESPKGWKEWFSRKDKNDEMVKGNNSEVDENASKHGWNKILGLPANGDSTLRKVVASGAKGWGSG